MKTALIFPGQGSQFIGMGYDFYSKYDVSRDIFNELNTVLDRDLSNTIFFGDENDLSKTQNSQPAIMATSIAIYEALKHENLIGLETFGYVAGHSLGEYSALVVNKSLVFEDSVKLLKFRSKAMQDSMPVGTGGMVAIIGCDESTINNILLHAEKHGKIFIANDNASGQIVLSGEIDAVKFIVANSRELKIRRAIQLPVSAPFHCELIHSASTAMRSEISNYLFNPFVVPFYSNVTAKKCNEKEIADLLVNQIVSKVRWREVIENMIKDGVSNFIEIGPGNVLTNLVKRASKNVSAVSISKLEDLEKLDNIKI